MDHPNIARVFDAGTTDDVAADLCVGRSPRERIPAESGARTDSRTSDREPCGTDFQTVSGRPYFVMELIRGVPITRYCDDNRLALRERLALFIDVCHAVQHAHQKGIIHRDLKPSNILVSCEAMQARSDQRGRSDCAPSVAPSLRGFVAIPKIIDFGIAKATAVAGPLTDKTLLTEMRQLIGTPAYMSPEQAGLSDLDIDTRSDIYSLGVLLYELLTGVTPFDAERLRRSDYDELRRIIREEDPPKPSTWMEEGTKARRHEGTKADDSGASFLRASVP
jgi:serine/threonine protein kinase